MWPLLAQHSAGTGGLQQTIDSLARTPLSQIVLFVAACTAVRMAMYGYLRNTVPHRRHGIYSVAKFSNEAMDAIVYAGVFVFMLIRPFAVQAFLIPSESMTDTLLINDFIVANKAIYRYSEPQRGDIMVFKPPIEALNADQKDVDFIKRCIGIPGDVVEVRDGKLWRNGSAVDEPYLREAKIDLDWKLIHYTGSARPDLAGRYVPVQISPDRSTPLRYNYQFNSIARAFAMGSADGPDSPISGVMQWKIPDTLTDKELQYERELEAAPPAAVPKGFVLMMGDNRNGSYDGRAWGLVKREDVIGRSEFIWLPVSRWRITR